MAESRNPADSESSPDTRRLKATALGGGAVNASQEAGNSPASGPENDNAQTRPVARQAPVAGGQQPVVQIGAFEVIRPLGAGTYGRVYLAREAGIDRLVALKVIHAGSGSDREEIDRFEAEARLQGNLRANGFVRIYSAGKSEAGPWLAMEYCPGGTLGRWLDRRALPPRTAAEIAHSLARIVGAAHAESMVHRDLKPGNILLARELRPGDIPAPEDLKIGDLGLAKVMGDAVAQVSGDQVGTPLYMAPEQAAPGTPVGPSADVHALGVIIYELITGRVPYQGAAVSEVVSQLVHDDPVSPRLLVPTCPRDLEQICLKCLAKDPARRYPNATLLADDMAAFLDGRPVSARPPGWLERTAKRIRRRPAQAVAAALGFLLVASVVAGSLVVARLTVLSEARQEETRVRGLLQALLTANADGVRAILPGLAGNGALARQMARNLLAEESLDPRGRQVLELFLYPENATSENLVALAASGEPAVLALMTEAFRLHPPQPLVVEAFWDRVRRSEGVDPVIGLASMLALLDPDNKAWDALDPLVARELLAVGPSRIGPMAGFLTPRSEKLVAAVGSLVNGPDASPAELGAAFQAMAALAGNDAERIVDQVLSSASPVPGPLMPALKADKVRALASLRAWRAKVDNSARLAALRAMEIALGEPEAISALEYRPDPSTRTELTRIIHTVIPDPVELASMGLGHSDAGVLSGCVLALGEYDSEKLERRLQKWTGRLFELYRSHPDAGVHGAVDWLLRQRLGLGRELDAMAREMAGKPGPAGQSWEVSPGGTTWLVSRGPVRLDASRFVLPANSEPAILNGALPRAHEVVIPRAFAISTRLVTQKEYRVFRPVLPPGNEDDSSEAPVRGVSFADALAYCRWLSAREGISEEQMAVAPLPADPESMIPMPESFLRKTGYRLPTDWECEYAWRGGTSSRWHWGDNGMLLGRYGVYPRDSSKVPRAGAMARPNAFGMFDMAGANTWQWTLTTGGPRLVEARSEILDDEAWQLSGLGRGYFSGDRLLMRGTSLISFPDLSASSYRGVMTPFNMSDQSKARYGIRLARTLPAMTRH